MKIRISLNPCSASSWGLLLAGLVFVLLLSAMDAPAATTFRTSNDSKDQPLVPISIPEGLRISSEDRIQKSCTYLSVWFGNSSRDKSSQLEISQNPLSCFPAESSVQHRFNNGQTYTLHAFSGKYVQWQIPNSWIDALDAGEIRQLVDLTDIFYAHYAELVHGEPSGTGLLTISVNPQDLGTEGVGCVGCKGIELSNGTLDDFKKEIHVPAPGGWLTHEMGHNFDIYDSYIGGYYPDWPHAWTSVAQFYIEYYGRWGDYLGDGDDALARWLRKEIVPWDAMGAGASWARCVRNGGGCEAYGVTANDSFGGMVLRFAKLHGTSALLRVFQYLSDYKASHPTPPTTPEAKNDLLVTALAAGARMNISCELDTWHWEFSQSVRSQLATTYPGQDPFCLDADGDGYSPARGDCNDHNRSIHPGAPEIINGIDDDCDGFVDDVHINEQNDFTSNVFQAPTINSSLPLRITGHASSSDQDAIRVKMGNSLYLQASLRSFNALQGEFDMGSILNGGAGWGIFNFAPNSITNFNVSVPVGSDGFVEIKPSSGSSGNYELILEGTPPHRANPIQLATSTNSTTGEIHIVANTNLAPVDGERPTNIRFWANGQGFIQELPVSQTVSFDWTPPSGYCGSGISAQLVAGDHPISVPTPSNSETLANISTRSFVQTGDNVMIGGFIVQGTETKRVIIRAIGPELSQFGVSNSLSDPTLELHNVNGALIASNDNFQTTMMGGLITSDQVQDILNSGYAPGDSRESAIIVDLPAGNYTAIVRGVNNATGVALVEVYDLSPDNGSILRNISTRSVVQTGDNVMIGGFIVKGTQPKKVIVRAIGPELTQYGVPDPLANPRLELHNAAGALIGSNDDWQHTIIGGVITGSQVADIQNSGHAPANPSESAIIAELQPGNYTAIARGVNSTTGVALVEVYDLN